MELVQAYPAADIGATVAGLSHSVKKQARLPSSVAISLLNGGQSVSRINFREE